MWGFLRVVLFIFFTFGKVGLESFGKLPPREHHAPSAAHALQPDIRSQARHCPLVGAAGMLFAQAQVIVEAEVRQHL